MTSALVCAVVQYFCSVQVIASQQAEKAERQCQTEPRSNNHRSATAVNGVTAIGPPPGGRRVLPGAVRRMVNRMIKPRTSFFSQMPKEAPPPTAAAWPAVVSGAPGGAGRQGADYGVHATTPTPKEPFIPAGSSGAAYRSTVSSASPACQRTGPVGAPALISAVVKSVRWAEQLVRVQEYCESEHELVRKRGLDIVLAFLTMVHFTGGAPGLAAGHYCTPR